MGGPAVGAVGRRLIDMAAQGTCVGAANQLKLPFVVQRVNVWRA